jgi:hypothetical protein
MSADDWIAIGTMFLFGATLLGAFFALAELRNGLEETKKANIRAKKQATVDFAIQTLDRRIYWQSDLPHPRDAESIRLLLKQLKEDPGSEDSRERKNKLRSYLGFWEVTAVALSHNVFDQNLFQDMMKTHFLLVVKNYRPFIEDARKEFGDDSKELYVVMLKLAAGWGAPGPGSSPDGNRPDREPGGVSG